MVRRQWLSLAIILCTSGPAAAHDFTITDALIVIKSNKTYQIDLTLDVDALAMKVPPRLHTPELYERLRQMGEPAKSQALENARRSILHRFRLEFDGRAAAPVVSFPDHEALVSGSGAASPIAMTPPSVFGVTVRLSGSVPEGARELTFGGDADAGIIQLTILDQGSASGAKHLLSSGTRSLPFQLDRSAVSSPENDSASMAIKYFVLGFQHIVPEGLDHILFVLGLFLFSAAWRPLLIQVSAFTVAHTLTLALSIYGIIELPSWLVETVIALSIAYVAIENVFAHRLRLWRPILVFVFGLLHGMGFAGVLRELGLPPGQFVPALISFNVGVEAGQLAVIALAALAVGWWRHRPWYRRRVVIPASLVIAAVGLYWAFDRAVYGV